MATLKEVAKLAEVSTATVSKVLSNTPYVSEETRARVMEAVERLGYVPNLAARALSKGRTYIIGVIFPRNYDYLFSDPHVLTVIEGIETVATDQGYNILLSTPRVPVSDSEQFQRLVRGGYLDGVIALETLPGTPVTALVDAYDYPWVAIGQRGAHGKFNTIQLDEYAGSKAAAEYVIGLGHRHIGIIAVESDALFTGPQRLAGYRAAFEAAGLDYDRAPTVVGHFSMESGYEAAEQLLGLRPRPTAILCLNDRMAMGAIRRARAEGLHIPEDLSVVGFDDIPGAAYFSPPLTTVQQPAKAMGARAAEMLFELIEHRDRKRRGMDHKTEFEPVVFPTQLLVRDSTAVVRSEP